MISKDNRTGTQQSTLPGATHNVIGFSEAAAKHHRRTRSTLPGKPAEIVAFHGGARCQPETPGATAIADMAHRVLNAGADNTLATPVKLDPALYDLLAERLQEAEMASSDEAPMLSVDLTDDERRSVAMGTDLGLDQGLNTFSVEGEMLLDSAPVPQTPTADAAPSPAEKIDQMRQTMHKLTAGMQEELADIRQFQSVLGELKQEVKKLAASATTMQRAFGYAAKGLTGK